MLDLEQVCFQYHIIGVIDKQVTPVLIDTGSGFSQISEKYITNRCQGKTIQCLNFDNELRTYKYKTEIELNLSGIQTFRLKLYIGNQPNDLLLGVDFLENIDFIITKEFIILDGVKHRRYKISKWNFKKVINGS